MRKSGLQKQISSIFKESPIPVGDVDAAELPTEPVEQSSVPVEARVTGLPVSKSSMPSLTQRLAQEDEKTGFEAVTETVHTPAVPMMRPCPLKRTRDVEQKPQLASLSAQLKKAAGGSKGMDPKQKKMTVMVGVLSVVFGVVLFISLGGMGGVGAKAAVSTQTDEDAAVVINDVEPLQWHRPQLIPEQLRDPMKLVSAKVEASNETETSASNSGALVVKGIVFSRNNPTAIINERIVAQGETINGAEIVSIGREQVEFEKNGNRWTQSVQR